MVHDKEKQCSQCKEYSNDYYLYKGKPVCMNCYHKYYRQDEKQKQKVYKKRMSKYNYMKEVYPDRIESRNRVKEFIKSIGETK